MCILCIKTAQESHMISGDLRHSLSDHSLLRLLQLLPLVPHHLPAISKALFELRVSCDPHLSLDITQLFLLLQHLLLKCSDLLFKLQRQQQQKQQRLRGSCYGIHRTRVMWSLHVATISVRASVSSFNREDFRCHKPFVTDEDPCGWTVLLTLK